MGEAFRFRNKRQAQAPEVSREFSSWRLLLLFCHGIGTCKLHNPIPIRDGFKHTLRRCAELCRPVAASMDMVNDPLTNVVHVRIERALEGRENIELHARLLLAERDRAKKITPFNRSYLRGFRSLPLSVQLFKQLLGNGR